MRDGVNPAPSRLEFTNRTSYKILMGKLYSICAFASLWVNSLLAQGTIAQFSWHGDSNFFQAAFQVPMSDLQPGVQFSDMFMQTLAVTNPVGQTYHGGDSTSAGSGYYAPWDLSVQMNDFQRSTQLGIAGGPLFGSSYRTSGSIWEQPMSSTPFLWSENGYWSWAQIPEPSSAAFLITGALVALCRLKKRPAG